LIINTIFGLNDLPDKSMIVQYLQIRLTELYFLELNSLTNTV